MDNGIQGSILYDVLYSMVDIPEAFMSVTYIVNIHHDYKYKQYIQNTILSKYVNIQTNIRAYICNQSRRGSIK